MSRLLTSFALTTVTAVAATGCGGGGGGSALEESLGYLPKDAPFAVTIDTNVDGGQYKAGQKLLKKFPFGDQVLRQFQQRFEQTQGGVNFRKDVKPILGNPFVVGGTDARELTRQGDSDNFVGVLQAKDKAKLDNLIKKSKAKERGEREGAKIYRDTDGDEFAIKEDTLIVAGSTRLLNQALQNKEGDDKLDEATFNQSLAGLPGNAAVKIHADVQGIIRSDPDSGQARKVKWVNGLRALGATGSVKGDQLAVDFNLKTEGLSAGDLPFAGGGQAPELVNLPGSLNFGLRDAGQLLRFSQQSGSAVESGFPAALRQIEQGLGVDIERDLIDQLKGDTSVNVDIDGDFAIRSEVSDPARFERTLAKIARAIPRLARSRDQIVAVRKRGDFFAAAQADGDVVVFGVANRVFVASTDPATAGRLGTQTTASVPGGKGSLVMTADGERLAQQAIRQLAPQLGAQGALGGSLFTGPIGDLTGSVTSNPGGMRGSFKLTFD